ncbi:phosphatidate cytidylyltransferase [uncultured Gilliamella sp.]|uniref:phosphatidate cytidylyltransferase n=1 Tax=uncultured Gilliamella sp. TaxID=1193505 RepID=UPI0025DB6B70|nr:phosphatidate cytidylyltransferase [uncultured Gilliamella sp.]
MLIHRLLAAIILIPSVIFTLFYAPLPIFTYIMFLVCGLAAWEWAQFLQITKKPLKLGFATIFVILLILINYFPMPIEIKSKLFLAILVLSSAWWLIALCLVITYPNTTKYWGNSISIKLLFALFTLVPFFIGMIALRSIGYGNNNYIGATWLLYVFILVWATDTGAYFIGRSFGNRKLAAKVSPGKTIEGFIGGVSLAMVVCFGAYFTGLFTINFSHFIISSLLAIFVSVLGDLTESMFKREAGIKDSGNLIPGHGGILDRIDSLTAAVPIFATLSLYIL